MRIDIRFSLLAGRYNKSLDASGGSVFRIMTGPAMLNEFAPPRQLNRWALIRYEEQM